MITTTNMNLIPIFLMLFILITLVGYKEYVLRDTQLIYYPLSNYTCVELEYAQKGKILLGQYCFDIGKHWIVNTGWIKPFHHPLIKGGNLITPGKSTDSCSNLYNNDIIKIEYEEKCHQDI